MERMWHSVWRTLSMEQLMLPWTSISLRLHFHWSWREGFLSRERSQKWNTGQKESLRKGWRQWDMWPKSREQCRTDQTQGPADAGETREVGKGCMYKELDATLLMPPSPPAPYCFFHWAWVRGNCRWGSLCKDISCIVARNHFWSQQYLSKSAELCYGKAVAEDKCGNVFLSPDQWWSSRKRMGWKALTIDTGGGERGWERKRQATPNLCLKKRHVL